MLWMRRLFSEREGGVGETSGAGGVRASRARRVRAERRDRGPKYLAGYPKNMAYKEDKCWTRKALIALGGLNGRKRQENTEP